MLKYTALRRSLFSKGSGPVLSFYFIERPGSDIVYGGRAMLNLQQVENGQRCKVTWMIGEVAEEIKKAFDLQESDSVLMVENMGKSGVIVRYKDHRLAMDPSAAFAVKVESLA